MTITNREEIVEQLTEMLMQFDKDANSYQTDVYLYYDEENQTAELDTFVNVGGNSWLDDDHYTIYCDKEHYDGGMWGWCQTEYDFADVMEIPRNQFRNEVIQFLELDEDEIEDYELDYSDAERYIKTRDDYMEKLQAAYEECIDDMRPDYIERAEEIMREFDEEQAYEEKYREEMEELWK